MLIGGEGAVPRAMLGGKVSGLLGAAIFPAFNPKCLLGVPNSIFEYIGVAYLTGNKSSGIFPVEIKMKYQPEGNSNFRENTYECS